MLLQSTARDALQMGYNVIFVSDANATLSDEEHNGTLLSMAAIFADVMDTKHLLWFDRALRRDPVRRLNPRGARSPVSANPASEARR